MFKHNRINWFRTTFLLLFHGIALSAFAFSFQRAYWPIMLGLYLWMGFATTFYLHRCLTHRSFETTEWIKAFFCLATAIGQQGDPVGWAGHHRWHHARSDQPEDNHRPADGFFYSHIGWLFRDQGDEDERQRSIAKDLRERYFYLRWSEKPYVFLIPHVAVASLLYSHFGWGGMAWCLYLPMIGVYHTTFGVTSLCHWPGLGYRTTETPDDSRNFWLIGLLALGEGWHNNHHACASRAAHGLQWFELDATKGLIALLEKLGLAWDVKWQPPAMHAAPESPALAIAAINSLPSHPSKP